MIVKKEMLKDAGFKESANFWSDKKGHEIRIAELTDMTVFELKDYLDELS